MLTEKTFTQYFLSHKDLMIQYNIIMMMGLKQYNKLYNEIQKVKTIEFIRI